MPNFDYDVIVIGAGPAGVSAAIAASASGSKVLLLDKEGGIGGECLNFGCIPSKTLVNAAAAMQTVREMAKLGVKAVSLSRPDFVLLRDKIDAVIAHIKKAHTPELLKQQYGIDFQAASPSFEDSHTLLIKGKTVTAKNIIIATGTRPSIPDIEGIKSVAVLTNREVYRLDALPDSMIILGSGPHALETAQSFARLGTKITIIDFHHCLLAAEDADISALVTNALLRDGVRICSSHKVVAVSSAGQGVKVRAHNGLTQETVDIEADKLFVAVGRRENIEGLELEKAGVHLQGGHIKVDRHLRTSCPNIYAVGDINGEFPYAHAAIYQGNIAGMNSSQPAPQAADYSLLPRNMYLDPEVASIGYNEMRAHAEGIKFDVHVEQFSSNERALTEDNTEGFLKVLLKGGKPIGVHIIGANAGELIGEWLHVLSGRVTIAQLSQAIHSYPTRGALSQLLGSKIVFPKFFENPVMRWFSGL